MKNQLVALLLGSLLFGCSNVLDEKENASTVMPEAHDIEVVSAEVLDTAGISYGGVLREGPSRETPKIASLKEGEKVHLIERAEESMNGYSWFKVTTSSGLEGYQWGGLLCSIGIQEKGIYKECL